MYQFLIYVTDQTDVYQSGTVLCVQLLTHPPPGRPTISPGPITSSDHMYNITLPAVNQPDDDITPQNKYYSRSAVRIHT